MFKVKGKVVIIGEPEVYSDVAAGRMIVLQVNSKPPQLVPFFCYNEKINLLDEIEVGEIIRIAFYLRGRSYQKGDKLNYYSNNNIIAILNSNSTREVIKPRKRGKIDNNIDFYNEQSIQKP